MELIRTFVAIELDSTIRTALEAAQRALRKNPVSRVARWVAPDGIHLTLRFLGDIPSGRVAEISQALERTSRPFAPFSISLAPAGFFPNAQRLRVVWVGVHGDVQALARLQGAVESALNPLGFAPEGRGFQPHLTLARVRDVAQPGERQELARLISTLRVDSSAAMLVHEVSFIRSELRPMGAVYTRLAAIPLTGQR